ncbi:hypothetical protein [Deinococcus depolymerans]
MPHRPPPFRRPTSWQMTALEGRRALIPLLTLATLGTVHQTGFGVTTWMWVITGAGLLIATASRSRPAGVLLGLNALLFAMGLLTTQTPLLLSGLLVALCAPWAAHTGRRGGCA